MWLALGSDKPEHSRETAGLSGRGLVFSCAKAQDLNLHSADDKTALWGPLSGSENLKGLVPTTPGRKQGS